jgi:hypothetical protein
LNKVLSHSIHDICGCKQILSNTAFNSTAEQIGVLVATDETTLDPLTVNRNVNMLSDMFYGAMLAGGETELDGLFPMSLFPTVTQAQPFGDLANQFMQSVIEEFGVTTFVGRVELDWNLPESVPSTVAVLRVCAFDTRIPLFVGFENVPCCKVLFAFQTKYPFPVTLLPLPVLV